MNDPIIEEIRTVRKAFAEQCGFDLKVVHEKLREIDAQNSDHLASEEVLQCLKAKTESEFESPRRSA